MPVSVEHLHGYPRFSGSIRELSATFKVRLDWNDIGLHFRELYPVPVGNVPSLPASVVFGSSSIPSSQRITLYADTVEYTTEFEGAQSNSFDEAEHPVGFTMGYDKAIATITYRSASYDRPSSGDPGSSGDPIVTRKTSTGASFLTLPNRKLKWLDTQEPVIDDDVSAGVLVVGKIHHITLHRVTAAYASHLYALDALLAGHVNLTAFEGIGSEKLLYLGADFQQTITPLAQSINEWTVELKFQERNIPGTNFGWNHFLDPEPDTPAWGRIVMSDGQFVYPLGNFNQFYFIP